MASFWCVVSLPRATYAALTNTRGLHSATTHTTNFDAWTLHTGAFTGARSLPSHATTDAPTHLTYATALCLPGFTGQSRARTTPGQRDATRALHAFSVASPLPYALHVVRTHLFLLNADGRCGLVVHWVSSVDSRQQFARHKT